MKIFGISGLGADERVFKYIKLHHEIITVKWLNPQLNEDIKNYVKRLSDTIDQIQPFVLIGVSFGGIVAIELSKIIKPKATFIVSSVENCQEMPKFLKIIGKTKIINHLPKRILKLPFPIASLMFGAENRLLLKEIIKDTDLDFAKWALAQFINWNNVTKTNNLIQIHGDRDILLPIKNKSQVIRIKDGGHFMVVDKADEISTIINDKLDNLQNNVV